MQVLSTKGVLECQASARDSSGVEKYFNSMAAAKTRLEMANWGWSKGVSMEGSLALYPL